jgi:hypothetical protein
VKLLKSSVNSSWFKLNLKSTDHLTDSSLSDLNVTVRNFEHSRKTGRNTIARILRPCAT